MRSIPGTITEHPVARAKRESDSDASLLSKIEGLIDYLDGIADEHTTDSPLAKDVSRRLGTILDDEAVLRGQW